MARVYLSIYLGILSIYRPVGASAAKTCRLLHGVAATPTVAGWAHEEVCHADGNARWRGRSRPEYHCAEHGILSPELLRQPLH